MKQNLDKRLFTVCCYIACTALAVYVGIRFLDNLPFFLGQGKHFLQTIVALLRPVIYGLIIAYLLHFIAYGIEHFLARHKIFKSANTQRILGIVSSYLIVVALVIALITGTYIMIGGQISKNTTIGDFISYIINYLTSYNAFSKETLTAELAKYNIILSDVVYEQLATILTGLEGFFVNAITAMFSSVIDFFSNIITFFAAFFLSIYFLKDKEYFLGLWNKLFYMIFRDSRLGKCIRYALQTANATFSNYIRGQLTEACLVGLMSILALGILQIENFVMIGIFSGITNMIPYVGPWIGTILAAIMALFSGEPIKIIYVIVAMQIVQQIDNNLLAPKVVGGKVGLHAVFTMAAILIGGNTGGLLGMLIAVPIAATLKSLISAWYHSHAEFKEPSA